MLAIVKTRLAATKPARTRECPPGPAWSKIVWPPLKIQRKNSEARRLPTWSNPIEHANDVGHPGTDGRWMVCQSQKFTLRYNGSFGTFEIGKPLDAEVFSLLPRERHPENLPLIFQRFSQNVGYAERTVGSGYRPGGGRRECRGPRCLSRLAAPPNRYKVCDFAHSHFLGSLTRLSQLGTIFGDFG